MSNYITLSNSNPFKFYRLADSFGISAAAIGAANLNSFDPSINSRNIDEDFYYRNVDKWLAKIKYFQPFQMSDPLQLQWEGIKTLGAGAPFSFYVLNNKGAVVKTISVSSGSSLSATHRLYSIFSSLADLNEGIYFFMIKMTGYFTILDEYLISEPIKLKLKHEGTALIRYKNTSNDFGIYYESGVIFSKRVYGRLKELQPNAKFSVYQNEPMDLTMLSGVSTREYQFEIGSNKNALPMYEIDKLDTIFLHDTVYLDEILVTRADGAQIEKIPVKESELTSARLKLAKSSNNNDLTVSSIQSVVLYTMPKGDVVFIDKMSSSSPALTYNINQYFQSHNHLLAYLNSYYGAIYKALDDEFYFSINDKGELLANCGNSTTYTVFENMTVNKILDRYIKLKVDTAQFGTGSVIIDVVPTAGAKLGALFPNDGTANSIGNYTGASTLSHNYTTVGVYDFYLFTEQYNTITNNSDPFITRLDGLIHKDCTDFIFNNSSINVIGSDLTKHCEGNLTLLDLQVNNLYAATVEEQVMYLYENLKLGAITSSLTALFNLQLTSYPTTRTDTGFASIASLLTTGGVTIALE